ncbi:hypothetical protein HPG69_018009, partial [Diceros bicornis minor]
DKVEMQRQHFRLEFEKYHGFLAQEEQLQLRRLEEEEQATLQRLPEGRLCQQSRALKELAEELRERCQCLALGLLEVRMVNVNLDAATAHPYLLVTSELHSVQDRELQRNVLNDPE